MANIEEARYRVLLTRDGKSLVESRYAVRNNQRNFVKVTLPPGAMLWSATLAGKPVRPGSAPDGSLLLPLAKSHAGDDAPEFALDIVYLLPGTSWTDKGRVKLALPALDLPVSRTGLQIFYPPVFRLSPEPGSFHSEAYENPASTVLVAAVGEPACRHADDAADSRNHRICWGPALHRDGHAERRHRARRETTRGQNTSRQIQRRRKAAPAPRAFFPCAWISRRSAHRSIWFPNSPVKINLRPRNFPINRTKRQVASETPYILRCSRRHSCSAHFRAAHAGAARSQRPATSRYPSTNTTACSRSPTGPGNPPKRRRCPMS